MNAREEVRESNESFEPLPNEADLACEILKDQNMLDDQDGDEQRDSDLLGQLKQ